jgi:SAM-dependent methyltransferase
MLAGWAIPEEILAAAPEPPYFFDPASFTAAAEEAVSRAADTPSDAAAREVLPVGGTVLDVGCGAGAASLCLRSTRVVGVDQSRPLLAALVEGARRLGIDADTIEGRWPDCAERVEPADVVVCHHVFYNVPDLDAFAGALSTHARRRVVVELTAAHPLAWLTPYWKALHGLDQPDRPTVADAVAVLEEMGLAVGQRRWRRRYQAIGETGDGAVARIARRLCVGPERYGELRRLLEDHPAPPEREVATLWWPG